MYCSNCGLQIPDESNFCLRCGKPQKDNIVAFQPKYEICEIVYDKNYGGFFKPDKLFFWAKATGEKGNYSAGESSIFESYLDPSSKNGKTVEAHDELVSKLLADGWERIETQGNSWFSFKFRRPQKKTVE